MFLVATTCSEVLFQFPGEIVMLLWCITTLYAQESGSVYGPYAMRKQNTLEINSTAFQHCQRRLCESDSSSAFRVAPRSQSDLIHSHLLKFSAALFSCCTRKTFRTTYSALPPLISSASTPQEGTLPSAEKKRPDERRGFTFTECLILQHTIISRTEPNLWYPRRGSLMPESVQRPVFRLN